MIVLAVCAWVWGMCFYALGLFTGIAVENGAEEEVVRYDDQ